MFEYLDDFEWPAAGIAGAGNLPAPGSVRMFEGLNPAVGLQVGSYVKFWDPVLTADRAALPVPGAPPTSGTEWTYTTVGAAPTLSYVAGFPPTFRCVTTAADGQGMNMQANALANGPTIDFQAGSRLNEALFWITMRVDDITQSEWFVGFAPTDTTILAGVANFVGIAKNDDSTLVRLVHSVSSVVPHSATTAATICDLASADATGATAVSDFLTFAVKVSGKRAFGGLINGREVSRGRAVPAHRASIRLGTFGAACVPSVEMVAGSAAARTFDIAKIGVVGKYLLGGKVRA